MPNQKNIEAYRSIDWRLQTGHLYKDLTQKNRLWDFHQALAKRIEARHLDQAEQGLWTLAIVKSILEVKLNKNFMVGAIAAFKNDLSKGVYKGKTDKDGIKVTYVRDPKKESEFFEYKKASRQEAYDAEKGDMLRTSLVKISNNPHKLTRLSNDLLATFVNAEGLNGFINMYESFMTEFTKLKEKDQNECLDAFIDNIKFKETTGCVNDRSGNALTAMQMKMLSKLNKEITETDFLKQLQDIYSLYADETPLDLKKLAQIDKMFNAVFEKYQGYKYIDPGSATPSWIIDQNTIEKLKEKVLNFITSEDAEEKQNILKVWAQLLAPKKQALPPVSRPTIPINADEKELWQAIYDALYMGKSQKAAKLFFSAPVSMQDRVLKLCDSNGETLLHLAARLDNGFNHFMQYISPKMLNSSLEVGNKLSSPLHIAAAKMPNDQIHAFLNRIERPVLNRIVQGEGIEGWSLLHCVFASKPKAGIAFLKRVDREVLDKQLSLQLANNGPTALQLAVINGNYNLVMEIINEASSEGLNKACLKNAGSEFGVLETLLNYQRPAVVAALLAKINDQTLQTLLESKKLSLPARQLIAKYRFSEPTWKEQPLSSRLTHILEKNTYKRNPCVKINTQEALDLIKNEKALVKNISVNLTNEESLNFVLKQIKDPQNFRPIPRDFTRYNNLPEQNRNEIYNPIRKEWEKRKAGARGRSKVTQHTKKTSTSLLPRDGMMRLFNTNEQRVGLLFDYDLCKMRGENAKDDKYIFKKNAVTDLRWWYQDKDATWLKGIVKKIKLFFGKDEHREKHLSLVTTVADLRKDLREERGAGRIPEHNEILARLSKNAFKGVFAPMNTEYCRLNTLLRKFQIKEMLDLDLPVLIITPNRPAKAYDFNQQLQDLVTALSAPGNKPEKTLAREVLFQLWLDNDPLKAAVENTLSLPKGLMQAWLYFKINQTVIPEMAKNDYQILERLIRNDPQLLHSDHFTQIIPKLAAAHRYDLIELLLEKRSDIKLDQSFCSQDPHLMALWQAQNPPLDKMQFRINNISNFIQLKDNLAALPQLDREELIKRIDLWGLLPANTNELFSIVALLDKKATGSFLEKMGLDETLKIPDLSIWDFSNLMQSIPGPLRHHLMITLFQEQQAWLTQNVKTVSDLTSLIHLLPANIFEEMNFQKLHSTLNLLGSERLQQMLIRAIRPEDLLDMTRTKQDFLSLSPYLKNNPELARDLDAKFNPKMSANASDFARPHSARNSKLSQAGFFHKPVTESPQQILSKLNILPEDLKVSLVRNFDHVPPQDERQEVYLYKHSNGGVSLMMSSSDLKKAQNALGNKGIDSFFMYTDDQRPVLVITDIEMQKANTYLKRNGENAASRTADKRQDTIYNDEDGITQRMNPIYKRTHGGG